MQATLTTISGERSALDTALTNKDEASLKTINANLESLWKQFVQETRDSVKAHYTAARAAAKASATGTVGTVTNPVLSPSAAKAIV
jgi:hypothetical protein